MDNEKKEIEIIAGNGSEITISEVSEHLNALRPKSKEDKKKKIVIPKED